MTGALQFNTVLRLNMTPNCFGCTRRSLGVATEGEKISSSASRPGGCQPNGCLWGQNRALVSAIVVDCVFENVSRHGPKEGRLWQQASILSLRDAS